MKYYLFFLLCFCSLSNAASFDCNKAISNIEKAVCLDEDLSNYDFSLGAYYRFLNSYDSNFVRESVKKSQARWVLERNTKCENSLEISGCLRKVYKGRLFELTDKYIEITNEAFFDYACDMSEGGQNKMTGCAKKMYESSLEYYSRELNRVLTSEFEGDFLPSKATIKENTEFWKKYVESHCGIKGSGQGSIFPMREYICLKNKYKLRALELMEYACSSQEPCERIYP